MQKTVDFRALNIGTCFIKGPIISNSFSMTEREALFIRIWDSLVNQIFLLGLDDQFFAQVLKMATK